MPTYKYIHEVAPAQPANGSKPAVGPEYRNTIAKDGPPSLEGVTTLYELFQRSVKKYGKNKCLGHREVKNGEAGAFVWETYEEVDKDVTAIGSALASVGVTAGGRVGIYGSNAPQWMKAMQVQLMVVVVGHRLV